MSRGWRVDTACFILILLAFLPALADTRYEPLYLVRGVRPMGLGNAFEAIADDENAFHYNPAGLAQRDDMLFHLLIVRPRISSDLAKESLSEIRDLYDTIDTLMAYDDPLGDQSPECREAREDLADRIEEALTDSLGARLDLPSIGFAAPFLVAEKYRMTVGSAIYTQSSASLRVEPRGLAWADPVKDMLDNAIVYNIAAQWAWEVASAVEIPVNKPPLLSRIYVGTAARRVSRSVFTDENNPFAVEDVLNPDGPDGIEGTDDDFTEKYFDVDQDLETIEDFIDFVGDNAEKRVGYGIDLGTILVPFDGLKLAFVVRNLASYVALPEGHRHFPRNVVFSASTTPLVFLNEPPSYLDMTLAASLDRRNGDDRMSDFSASRYTDRIHLGAEVTLFPNNSVSFSGRIGNNQGFLTLGASLKLANLYLDFARYGDLETDWHVGCINLSMSL